MASRFKLQIVDRLTEEIIEMAPGSRIEMEFVEDILKRLATKGIGLLKTTNHVLTDVEAAIEEAIFELKAKVRPHD